MKKTLTAKEAQEVSGLSEQRGREAGHLEGAFDFHQPIEANPREGDGTCHTHEEETERGERW